MLRKNQPSRVSGRRRTALISLQSQQKIIQENRGQYSNADEILSRLKAEMNILKNRLQAI